MDIFYADLISNRNISWDNLFADLNKSETYNPFCFHADYYNVFKNIILSLVLDEELILLDTDFSNAEVEKLTGYSNFVKFERSISKNNLFKITSKDQLLLEILKDKKKWSITLFTSGTTGLPKKIKHSFNSISRFVKRSENNSKNIWGFAYNPTHMAGIQVFCQALMNGNTIVRLFGLSNDVIFESIKRFNITHISGTPTFYRLLLPSEMIFPQVERITSGGEKFDKRNIRQLQELFPNSKITNIYASTETGTLFASDGDTFSLKPEMNKYVKIKNNVMFIHKTMMGTTEAEIDEWYNTGDLVEVIAKDPLKFRFISRKNDMINVGGYKVNPDEVEETIRSIEGIQDVRVFSKENSVLGNLIYCEIVRLDEKLDESTIRSFLQTELQEYKIPRMIKFVNKISTTRTGKIKRN